MKFYKRRTVVCATSSIHMSAQANGGGTVAPKALLLPGVRLPRKIVSVMVGRPYRVLAPSYPPHTPAPKQKPPALSTLMNTFERWCAAATDSPARGLGARTLSLTRRAVGNLPCVPLRG